MEIYIVRHGETVWNKKKLLQGRTTLSSATKDESSPGSQEKI